MNAKTHISIKNLTVTFGRFNLFDFVCHFNGFVNAATRNGWCLQIVLD